MDSAYKLSGPVTLPAKEEKLGQPRMVRLRESTDEQIRLLALEENKDYSEVARQLIEAALARLVRDSKTA